MDDVKARFHTKDGLFFIALRDGTVDIVKTNGPAPGESGCEIQCHVSLPEAIWASVVVSMSAEGETFDSWHEARLRHLGAQRFLEASCPVL